MNIKIGVRSGGGREKQGLHNFNNRSDHVHTHLDMLLLYLMTIDYQLVPNP